MFTHSKPLTLAAYAAWPSITLRHVKPLTTLRQNATVATQHVSSNKVFELDSELEVLHGRQQSQSPKHLLYQHRPFWHRIERWRGLSEAEFLSYRWQVSRSSANASCAVTDETQTANLLEASNDQRKSKLLSFLDENVPDLLPQATSSTAPKTKAEYVADVEDGIKAASMSVRLTPYILSMVNWNDPMNDPIARQFLPVKSTMIDDHSLAQLDSLHEEEDSPVKGLVHRYPDKVLFLGKLKYFSLPDQMS